MSDLTVDPSTITFSKHIGDSFTLDEFYDIDMINLELQDIELPTEEIEPSQSLAEDDKVDDERMDDVGIEYELEDETCPTRAHKRKLDDLDDHSNDTDSDTESKNLHALQEDGRSTMLIMPTMMV